MKNLVYAAVVASVGMTTIAMGQDISTVNGYNVEARLYNDFAATNLNINGTAYPAPALGAIASRPTASIARTNG